jgi:hypothetical protein
MVLMVPLLLMPTMATMEPIETMPALLTSDDPE